MITVKFMDDGKSLTLELIGHAGYDDVGKDIVCSAASILAYTLAQKIMQSSDESKLGEEPEISLNEGNTVISCAPKQDFYNDIYNTFSFALTGYKLLCCSYPDNVILVW